MYRGDFSKQKLIKGEKLKLYYDLSFVTILGFGVQRDTDMQDYIIHDLLKNLNTVREKRHPLRNFSKGIHLLSERTHFPRKRSCIVFFIEESEKLVSRFTDVSFYHAMLQCD
jgi:hypothetical protein